MAELNELRDGEVETLAMKITTLEETIECLKKSNGEPEEKLSECKQQ